MHSAQELVSQVDSLASIPAVYHRICELMDSPDSSMFEIARLISADPGLTVRLLRVVNSAMFGYRGTVDSVQRAAQILGLQQVHDIVLGVSLQTVVGGLRPSGVDIDRYWRQSMMCALCARQIAREGVHTAPERMFIIGLLANIGHLVMYQTAPALVAQAERAAAQGEPLHLAERRIIGCDFAEVGAALIEHWGVPHGFAGAIGAQTMPRLGGDYAHEAAIIHLASQLARADESGEASADVLARIDGSLWPLIGIEAEAVPRVREDAELNLAACIVLFFPPRTH